KEWLILMSLDEIDGVVSEKVSQVLALGILGGRVGFEIEVKARGLDRFVESAMTGVVLGIVAEVPLAEHACGVAGLFQRVGDGDFIEWQFRHIVDRPQWPRLPIEAIDSADGVDARARAVLSAHERCASGLTVGAATVAACELHSARGEAINVRRFVILAAEA